MKISKEQTYKNTVKIQKLRRLFYKLEIRGHFVSIGPTDRDSEKAEEKNVVEHQTFYLLHIFG